MRKLKVNFAVALAGVVCLCVLSASEAGQAMIKAEAVPAYQPKHFPFDAGEKEVYQATWNGMIAVATAEVQTTQTVIDGRKVYQVRVEAKTSRMLDFIWRMRDTISSTFDAKALAPAVELDHATKRWSVNRQQVGKETKIYQFDAQNTLDPITAVYLARSTDFKVGDKLYFKVFGGRYQYLLELFIEKKEPVALESGKTVEAYRIIPRIQNITKNGYASRLNEATIWISADERRLPIKLSSKIVFGTVYLELMQDKSRTQSTSTEARPPAS